MTITQKKITKKLLLSLSAKPETSLFLEILQEGIDNEATTCVEPHLLDLKNISANANKLVFVSQKNFLPFIEKGLPGIVISQKNIELPNLPSEITIFQTPSLSATMALVLPFLDDTRDRFANSIHPTAVVSANAQIGKGVRIGPFSVIGDDAVLEEESIIGPHCNIELGGKVGKRTILHSHVFLGARCTIGDDCEVFSFTTIGSDGFGFVQDSSKKRHKIPQLGTVKIGHRVTIGASCTIDRATLSETLIDDGTKIDNLCHIAHNCRIGKNGALTAGFNVAGSTTIGNNFMCGGQTGIADHVAITDNVILGARSGVTNDIPESGVYGGFPIQPMRDSVRTLASLPHLADLRRTVAQIQKKLGLEKK